MRKILALLLVSIILGSSVVAIWYVHNQISGLQNQISEVNFKNNELQNQTKALQAQVNSLQLENREQQDRLKDFTHELAKARSLPVEITDFSWDSGFYPIVGLTLTHPVTVTVQNDDVVPLFGLTLTFILVNKDTGLQIGTEGFEARIDRLDAGEHQEATGSVFTTIDTSLDNGVFIVTLVSSDIVLDQLRHET
jgi:outer membrane murein-binding lipoprotein Lpp